MKRALVALSVIVGLIAVVAVIGFLLPKEHTATAQRSYDRPPDAVWRLITDIPRLPEWRPNLKKVEQVSSTGEPLRWFETWERGDEMPFVEIERVHEQKLVVEIDSEDMPFGGSWTYQLEPTATGTMVTITENGEVRDPFFRFVSRLFMDPTKTMNVYLDDLGNALASTEPAIPIATMNALSPEMDRLVKWMTGSFSSDAQAANDSDYYDIRLEMVPIWTQRSDGHWLYVEQAAAGRLDAPYRQRVYRVSETEPGTFSSEVFTFDSPLRFAGAWNAPAQFDALTPDSLTVREGCTVWLTWNGDAYTGSTRDADCGSELRGATYATSEVTIVADEIKSWDRGFDADGQQVWGAEKGPYVFRRKP